jgi:iron complex transport system substrate-binding protein
MDRTRIIGLAAALVLFAAAGVAPAAAAETPAAAHTMTDAAGRAIKVADTSRVVTIGGAATEIVYALGLGDKVVAVDVSSTYPPSALANKPNVGYIRALAPEGVLSVGPSIIIATEGAGPPDAVNVLRSASVPFVTFPEARDAAQVVANIRFVAEVLGAPEAGNRVAAAVTEDFAALDAIRARIAQHRKAVFVLSASATAPVVGGGHTSADAILRLAGIDNAMSAMSGFKPAVDEAMLAVEPDAIVLMKDRNHTLSDDAVMALPAFKGTPAAARRHIYRIDGAYALAFGPRTPQAARDLAAAIYPELALPALPQRPWTLTDPTPAP